MQPARRWAGIGLVCLAAALGAGCAGSIAPKSITIPEDRLRALLARSFPLRRRLLVLDVEAPAPALRLLPEADQLALDLRVEVADRLSGRRYQGRLDLQSGLRFEPSDATLRLARVRVSALDFDALPPALARTANGIGALLAEQALEDLAVWQAAPRQLERLHAAGVRPGAVRVMPTGVEIMLEPLPR